jgi:hypothetical protein
MDVFEIVKSWFESFGYKVLEKPEVQDANCDMFVVGSRKSIRVEIKSMSPSGSGSWQVPPITENQRKCDCVAVVFPNKQVFVEAMDEYLAHVSDKGYRFFTWLKL